MGLITALLGALTGGVPGAVAGAMSEKNGAIGKTYNTLSSMRKKKKKKEKDKENYLDLMRR